jgi:hypothetical protein
MLIIIAGIERIKPRKKRTTVIRKNPLMISVIPVDASLHNIYCM